MKDLQMLMFEIVTSFGFLQLCQYARRSGMTVQEALDQAVSRL